jgi:hypothetical protein
MIFNTKNLLVENASDVITMKNMVTIEESYFYEAMNFVIESNKQFNKSSEVLYKALLESDGDPNVIHESFGDFFTKVKEIIDRFIAFIKSIFAKFITRLNAMISSDKYIEKHKEEFRKFSSKHEFEMPGYNFSISPAIPALHALESFTEDFVPAQLSLLAAGIKEDEKDKSKAVADKIKTEYDKLINSLDGDWYDKFRAKTIGMDDDSIYQSDFANELFMVYRSGESSKEDIKYTSSIVQNSYQRFSNYKKTSDDVKKMQESVEKEYKAIKKSVEEMSLKNYDKSVKAADNTDILLTKDLLTNMDVYVKAKVNQVQEMTAIHSLAFSAKLDALKECFTQDKTALYKALYKIQGTIKD